MKKIPVFVFGMMILVAGKTQDYKKVHEQAIVCDTHNDINDVVNIAQKFRKMFDLWELLIIRGISIDVNVDIIYIHKGSVRYPSRSD